VVGRGEGAALKGVVARRAGPTGRLSGVGSGRRGAGEGPFVLRAVAVQNAEVGQNL